MISISDNLAGCAPRFTLCAWCEAGGVETWLDARGLPARPEAHEKPLRAQTSHGICPDCALKAFGSDVVLPAQEVAA